MLIKIIILILIVQLKTIFASFETAITFLNRAKFNQLIKNPKLQKRRQTLILKDFMDNKNRTFALTRAGMILCELTASAFAAEAFVSSIEDSMEKLGLPVLLVYIVCVLIVGALLAYIMLVFGELLPKKVAAKHPEKTAYRYAIPFKILSKIVTPFEWFIDKTVCFFSSLFKVTDETEEKLTEKELKLIIAESKSQGLFDETERKLLLNAMRYDRTKVQEIMVPRDKIITINVDTSKEKLYELLKKYRFTRMPIYSGKKDNIIGFLNVKDVLIDILASDEITIDIKSHVRELLVVSRGEKINSVLNAMQLNNKSLALVKDKNGVIEGLITLEDIVEKLVGRIDDEYAN